MFALVLAQLCGTVIAKLELIGAGERDAQRIAALNAELESIAHRLLAEDSRRSTVGSMRSL